MARARLRAAMALSCRVVGDGMRMGDGNEAAEDSSDSSLDEERGGSGAILDPGTLLGTST